ncbi:MAG: Na+/H+ antiporter [Comamonadaceae bacterium]|nr:MAG: Na+/H+ antiporter [Comamonadaceae bacterium]
MNTLLPILGMLTLVACSGLLARWLPRLPLPLIQIAGGALLGWPAGGLHVEFDPQIFMLLFIPPMLFADGWQMPKREFGANKWPILFLSTALVLFTVGGLGYFIHWALPGMPLSVAFLLAAVLSPTDAVAVSAIVQRLNMPPRLQHILEGEALMNDAAALVAVKFAIAATLAGTFSLSYALWDFVLVAAGGVAVGVAFSWLFKLVHNRLLYWRDDHRDQAAQPTILLLLLMPFAPYLIAEHLHLSGVLAAVAAGMTASAFDVRSNRFNGLHLQTESTWEMVRFSFNGLIFVLLGMQLPGLLRHLPAPLGGTLPGYAEAGELLLLTLGITGVMLALRFIGLTGGAWLARGLMARRAKVRAPALASIGWAGVGALGGTRGGITLAAVLSVPLAMADGRVFPARDLLVFQATMVIVLSLVVATIGGPWLINRMGRMGTQAAAPQDREARWARNRASRAALRTIVSAPMPLRPAGGEAPAEPGHDAELVAAIRARVQHSYENRLQMAGEGSGRALASKVTALERHLRLETLQSERAELYRLRLSHRINDATLRLLLRDIDLLEMVIRSQPAG